MDAESFHIKYRKPYEEKVESLEREQRQLRELFDCTHQEGFAQVKTFFFKQRDEGREDVDRHSDRSIFTIWFFIKKIWQGVQKKKDADRFLSWIESIPQQLHEVSTELNSHLTKN
jgi:hypothetical protein